MQTFLRRCAIRLSRIEGEKDFDGNQGTSPEYFSDSENIRIATIERILLAALLTSPIMWSYAVLSYYTVASTSQWKIGILTSIVHMISPFLLYFGLSADWTISALLSMGLLHQASFSTISGGFSSNIVVWFAVLPLIAGVTGGQRLSRIWLLISSATALAFVGAEWMGVQFPQLVTREGFLYSHALLVFGMTVLGSTLSSILAASSKEREQQLSTQVGWVKNLYRVGGAFAPSSHTTVRTVRYTAVYETV